jgi:predicted O-linked N-acetylglucosamine transferase (SPINDLY family)
MHGLVRGYDKAALLLEEAGQLCAAGRLLEAQDLLEQFLRLSPHDAAAWILLAKLHYQQRDHARALEAAAQALRLGPTHAEAHYMLGRIHRARGALDEAEACYRRALVDAPANPDILISLGVLLRSRGQVGEAIALYRRALSIDPKHADAQNNLANALLAAGDASAEQERVRAQLLGALRQSPAVGELWLRLGKHDCAHGRAQLGLESVEAAIGLCPESAEAIEIARRIAAGAGLHERTLRYGGRMAVLAPDETIALATRLSLPCIQQSWEGIRATRDRYARGLRESLASDAPLAAPSSTVGGGTFAVPAHPAFYLAYHGLNDRDLQVRLAEVYLKRMPDLTMTAPHCQRARRSGGRIRVGFISRYLRKHSIGATTRGLIDKLSREHFEVYALRITPSAADAVTRAIGASADHLVELHAELPIAREQIAALELDVLFFQDIGMEPMSYFLAFARLAPVQCVSFGHPDTTGIPNMDYFISNDAFEPPDAAEHYSERLFLLEDLPTLAYYYRPDPPPAPVSREKFGFGLEDHVYLCPQTLYKLHPDFDGLLEGIFDRDPNARVVLIDGVFKDLAADLRLRWRRTLPAAAERIRFLPRLGYRAFLELLSVADVILDTVHFNGMNTSLEALALGTPVVTLPAAFQRGRHTQAMYRKMGITECIAADARHYADIAVRIGCDRDYAASLRERILARCPVLFEDRRVVTEFERFFLDATARSDAR